MTAGAATSTRRAATTVLAASTLTIMAAAVISPSLPAMRAAYESVPGADLLVKLVVTITSAAIAVSAPLSGVVASRIGTSPVLLAGLIVYAVSGTAGLIVTDLAWLMVTRVALGVAVGAIMTSVSTTIVALWRGDERARLLGGQQVFASLGGVIFLSLAGWLSTISWRAPFIIYAAALLVVPFAIMGSLAPPSLRDPTAVETSPSHRGRLLGIYALAFGATAVFFLAPTQLPFVLDALGVSTAVTGLVVAASTATGVIGSLSFSAIRRHLAPASVAATSLALLGLGWAVIGLAAASTWVGVLIGAFIGGIGVGLIVPDLNLWVSDLANPARRGLLLGGLVSAIFAGQFFSPILAQPLLSLTDIGTTFSAGGVAALVVAILLVASERFSSSRASTDAELLLEKGQNR